MRIGIFFGGPSREREISFAGGRTVYDNLNKTIFEPVPVFVDSNRRLILLDWPFVYKGSIRDFYPPVSVLPPSPNAFQVYIESLHGMSEADRQRAIEQIGQEIQWEDLADHIDFAFLTLHGYFGEDGQIQGVLDALRIPYTASGVLPSAIGMDKSVQKKWMTLGGFDAPAMIEIRRDKWQPTKRADLFDMARQQIGFPMVVRPANQGSSIGVSILREVDINAFERLVDAAFFRRRVDGAFWNALSPDEQVDWVRQITDIREGLGFPMQADSETIYHPEALLAYLREQFGAQDVNQIVLEGHWTEQCVILESFIHGREFSCIVIRKEDGEAVALPPTEIRKGDEVFDYRSKYLPGLSRKVTPIDIDHQQIEAIRAECTRLFDFFGFHTYARIDGFINDAGEIFLNDPNTTSGMLPSSFFFHQAAEIGLDPSQFISYIIRVSLQERMGQQLAHTHFGDMLRALDDQLERLRDTSASRKKIGVILGGYSFERHISVESGRNIYEKLSSSDAYEAIPIFLIGDDDGHRLYQIPVNLLLKDNADDIREKVLAFKKHPVVEDIKRECSDIMTKYTSKDVVFEPVEIDYPTLAKRVDGVFIALHGRPGEDGTIQRHLETHGIPYNGSGIHASRITINKFETLQMLKKHGFTVTKQEVLARHTYENDPEATAKHIERAFAFPLIAKPVDDGCSSAVKILDGTEALHTYLRCIFRTHKDALSLDDRKALRLKLNEEFPSKTEVLIEQRIEAQGAKRFLEITGGLLTRSNDGVLDYEIFEPSEALAGGEVLSLEEKFLAGEGQNITPARFAEDDETYTRIATIVKADFRRAAEILGIKGYARIDAFVRIFGDGHVETIIIEVNSLPGMTPATCIFHQSALNGYKPYDFIDKILEFAFNEQSFQGVEIP